MTLLLTAWSILRGSAIAKIALAGLAALVGLKAVQYSGVQKERARIEKKDSRHVSNAAKAGAASLDPSASGLRDRYIRDK